MARRDETGLALARIAWSSPRRVTANREIRLAMGVFSSLGAAARSVDQAAAAMDHDGVLADTPVRLVEE